MKKCTNLFILQIDGEIWIMHI